MPKPKIHEHAIDLLCRPFHTHKKGLPEWLKNARWVYLKNPKTPKERLVIINHVRGNRGRSARLECIDFGGVSSADIEERYLEWANPNAAAGISEEEQESGQGNGGKAYLRQLFEKGYFISIYDDKLSIVGFTDEKKYNLEFLERDLTGESKVLPGIRKEAGDWLEAYGYPRTANITIVRGVSPTKPIDSPRLMEEIQQFPQARQTISACDVRFHEDGRFRRTLKVKEPQRHPIFPNPIRIPIPPVLTVDGENVQTTKLPQYTAGEIEISISAAPLQGQALQTWNRIDFYATGLTVIGYKKCEEIPVEFPQYARHLFGTCRLPLLTDPNDNYESQGRGTIEEGALSEALIRFIAGEANKLLVQLAKQAQNAGAQAKRKNLERLNLRLADWIEKRLDKITGLRDEEGGEADTGDDGEKPGGPGTGKGDGTKKPPSDREKKKHKPAVTLKIHREALAICKGVRYQLRAIGYDEADKPVPPGKLTWRSQNPAVATVHPDSGVLDPKAPGLATVTVTNDAGLSSNKPVIITVHEAQQITIKTSSPATVGSNRRLQIAIEVKTVARQTLRDIVVGWKTSDPRVATVGQDGFLVGGDRGEAEVSAHAGGVTSQTLDVEVTEAPAGKPKGGGKGKPRILLSGQDPCPFNKTEVLLEASDPLVYQRPYLADYENNVFWINLQHPLPEALLKGGEDSVQWRTYHFQRVVDVYMTLMLRDQFGDDQSLDVDKVLYEMQPIVTKIYAAAKEDPEIFELLFKEDVDLENI